ncbi:transcription initiation factor TFIID subunit 6 [Magnaporthiopsis poae ATCC 64411]|uniref:TBP-associated factor 6 n=1 Tax=Magnaporthiopsis poae (strain ATCC 64411 / 73-15) TaxID=644358 RepID=A0A0C4DVP0_MAGP6|nr:transcription initiation factor TFIID subunit 6 [Magnaporthiopsis poae ATCC 64411]
MAASARPAVPAVEETTPKLLWNTENVKDVAESVGIPNIGEDALRCLSQDVEYRIGQVIVEALRFMRAANRTTLTVQDTSQAFKVLDVEPLYGYDSTRPLRYGEASLGPGQPLFYIDDEEVDFEKLINAPLPKVPRDMSFTAHWLAVEGVQPSIPQNPTSAESRAQELIPKGPGANPALSALAGNDNLAFHPAVKQIISKELVLYFDKIQAAVLDDSPDEETARLREAALESVRTDPGLHQLVPYFANFIANQVTHRLDDTFTLRMMMELTAALVDNPHLFLDPYAGPLSAPVLTAIMSRKIGGGGGSTAAANASGSNGSNGNGSSSMDVDGAVAVAAPPPPPSDPIHSQFLLREFAASLLGRIATKYTRANKHLRSKLTRTCLKFLLDPTKPPAVLYGALNGLAAAGGPEAFRVLVLPNLKSFDAGVLQPLQERAASAGGAAGVEFEALVGAIVKYTVALANPHMAVGNGVVNGATASLDESELVDFLGPIVGSRIAALGDRNLNRIVIAARNIE